MRWSLDQGLPRSTTDHLRDSGHDVLHVGDLGMAAASDPEIITHALELGRSIVTLDADFHDLLARSGNHQPSVLRIREEGLKAPELSRLIDVISRRFETELQTGCVMSYHKGKVRFRKLPLS